VGESLYLDTPLNQKLPFTPGYAVIGEVDAVDAGVKEMIPGKRVGVLTVTGGYTEILYRKSDGLIPVPEAAKANALLESGLVVGNVVLMTPELF
jgi:NADPH:quinone reductase-like Zn-dependent oxidoreductase